MINNPTIFYLTSFIITVFVFLTLCSKNIIYSLLSSVMVFFATALLFYLLGSEYNAIIQAAIYGFAVPIIIGLSIMFTTKDDENNNFKYLSFLVLICAVVFTLFFSDAVVFSFDKIQQNFHFIDITEFNHYDVISSFAKGIFINYVWAFELISLLLTIVIAGFTLFKKKGGKI